MSSGHGVRLKDAWSARRKGEDHSGEVGAREPDDLPNESSSWKEQQQNFRGDLH